jgi:RimJ/RimL family protein N-acetyltransferase/nucleotide-binding universal stress UspA family protein
VAVELRDGSSVLIRPVEADDRELLRAGFERLSLESRYRRFFSPMPHLTETQLDYLTQIDHHDHEAVVAIDPETGDGIGVARYIRTGPGVAEPAIVVVDDWQGRGVATLLLDRLVERALEEGVTRFVAPVLADNRDAIGMLERLGEATVELRGAEVQVTVDLPAHKADPAAPLRRLLRAVATGTFDPALTFWHRLVLRRAPLPGDLEDVVVAAPGRDGEGPVALAAEIARATGSRLVLVDARHPLGDDPAERLHLLAEQQRDAGLDVEEVIHTGDLAAALLDTAIDRRARLIVVPDEGSDPGVTGRLLGSAWDHVSHHAPCDVLIAR